jgi:hypothetical protein
MTRLAKIIKLRDTAQSKIDAGKTTPSDTPHIEHGQWVYSSKEQRTVNMCQGEISRLKKAKAHR